jgi:hemerythrin
VNAELSSYGAESAGTLDTEHQVQVALVHALRDAIRSGDTDRAREILEQTVEHSAVHFMSEQLLMRLCSYPDYDDHVLDHDHMMEELRRVSVGQAPVDSPLGPQEAEELMKFLMRHIATRDQRFTEYYRDWSRKARPETKA